jgi:hypothetical protein
VTEEKKKKVSPIKPSPALLRWLKDQVYERERTTGEKPSYADLLDELVARAAALPANEGTPREIPENVRKIPTDIRVLSEREKQWAGLVARAVTVRDPEWRRMLHNIQVQLTQVAEIADREQGKESPAGGGVSRRRDNQGTREPRSPRSGASGPASSGRKKAG